MEETYQGKRAPMIRQSAMTPAAATGAEAAQLAGQPGQIRELLFDGTAMLLRNAAHFSAWLGFLRRQPQQIPNLL